MKKTYPRIQWHRPLAPDPSAWHYPNLGEDFQGSTMTYCGVDIPFDKVSTVMDTLKFSHGEITCGRCKRFLGISE